MISLRHLMIVCVLGIAPSFVNAASISPDISGRFGVLFQPLPPVDTTGFPASVPIFGGTDGEGTLSAPLGLFDPGGGSLSTIADSDPFDVSFLNPVFGLQFDAAITDEFGGFLDGTLSLGIEGEAFSFDLGAGGYEPIAVVSTVGFQTATLTIFSFNTAASSIAFLDASAVYVATIAPIPLPAGALLLLSGVVILLSTRRRRAKV